MTAVRVTVQMISVNNGFETLSVHVLNLDAQVTTTLLGQEISRNAAHPSQLIVTIEEVKDEANQG